MPCKQLQYQNMSWQIKILNMFQNSSLNKKLTAMCEIKIIQNIPIFSQKICFEIYWSALEMSESTTCADLFKMYY